MTTRRAGEPRYSARSPFTASPRPVVEEFAVDDRVTHEKHGLGRVVAREPGAVVVAFGSQHVRVTSPFSRLTKL